MSAQLEKSDLRTYLHKNNYVEKLKAALGETKANEATKFISSVLATVAGNPALQRCTPESIALAAYDAATLGLPVNKLGLAWLVPYGNEAKFQIGYRGYIQLVLESGFVLDINAETIHENDQFRYACGTKPFIDHTPAFGKRGAVIGVYAIALLSNGLNKQVVMSKEDIDHIRSKSRSSGNSPWQTDYPEMAKKTVIKRLCKLLPYGVAGLGKVEHATEIEERYYQAQPQQPKGLAPIDHGDIEEIELNPVGEGEIRKITLDRLSEIYQEIKLIDPKSEGLPLAAHRLDLPALQVLLREKEEFLERIRG